MDETMNFDTQHIRDVQRIGQGTYGVVYRFYDVQKRKFFALKKISLVRDQEGVPSTCLREISILSAINHPNVIKLHTVSFVSGYDQLCLILEFVDWDLKKFLEQLKPRPLPINYVKSFLLQILRGVAHCHTRRVIHRDLKPQNILVQMDGTIKLADFGLARSISLSSRCYTHEIVTLWYRAPEVLLRARFYSCAVDVWSTGCIFAEMVTHKPLFMAESEIEQIFSVFRVLGTPTVEIWPKMTECKDYSVEFPQWKKCVLEKRVPGLCSDGLNLLAQMLLYSPEKRIAANTAVSHRFLLNVPANLGPVAGLLTR